MKDVAFSENARELLDARYLRRKREGEVADSSADIFDAVRRMATAGDAKQECRECRR
jgi:ribonucleotide reductase alpha subunit